METGEWIPVWTKGNRHSSILKCSICNHQALGNEFTGLNLCTPYCPFCGKKMRNNRYYNSNKKE